MPYKFETVGFKLGRTRSRRVRIKDPAVVRELYRDGQSIRGIARKFDVDKRTIQFILFPERLKRNLELREARGGWRQYYTGGETWARTMREHRKYKQREYLKEKL